MSISHCNVVALSFSFIVGLLCLPTANGFGESHKIRQLTQFDTAHRFSASAFGEYAGANVINFHVVNGDSEPLSRRSGDIIAGAVLYEDTNTTGWSYLTVHSMESFNDVIQAYWAGYVEGKVSWTLAKAHYYNTAEDYCPQPFSPYCERLRSHILRNLEWMKTKVVELRESDPFWHQVELQLWQLKGIEDAFLNRTGVNSSLQLGLDAFKQLTFDPFGIYLVQLSGDLEDLGEALGNTRKAHVLGNGACSALIKVLPQNADLYVSHDTWSEYQGMLRVLKHYQLPFSLTAASGSGIVPAVGMSFSSYPGVASSGDDFYIMDSGLTTLETTNGNFNTSLWDYVIRGAESSVFEFLRVQVANRLAKSVHSWVSYFGHLNSGTYNNQWMVVDYNQFHPGKELPDVGLLAIAEQLPGQVESADMTKTLKNTSYWASYNIPAFKNTFEISGYPGMVAKYGDWFTHEGSPRAQIFKRDHGKVTNMESMIDLMRYNDFQHDPLSRCNCTPPFSAENAIAARCDLNPKDGVYPFGALGFRDHGATDMKLVNSSLIQKLNFVALGGPTHSQLPVFKWSNSTFDKDRHLLHPDEWNFYPVVTPF